MRKCWTVVATLGKLTDFYFEDDLYTIRYLVIRMGSSLIGRSVLISPCEVACVNDAAGTIGLDLTCERVRSSPDIDADRPVSRRQEELFYRYYRYKPYWPAVPSVAAGITSISSLPDAKVNSRAADSLRRADRSPDIPNETHVRSCAEVAGYEVLASDAPIGHVRDFLCDDQAWVIQGVVAQTCGWLWYEHLLRHAAGTTGR
jgi:hypothetical protein